MTPQPDHGLTYVSYQYDAAGNVTRITWPDAFYVTYEYDLTGAVTAIRENGSTLLASYAYDNLGRRTTLTRGAGVSTSYVYDGLSRLSGLTHNPAGTTHDVTFGFAYNPASQIVSRTRSSATYDWLTQWAGTRSYGHNGLSQTISVTGMSPNPSHDGNGNMIWDGTATYAYDRSNRMISAGAAALTYDPAGRLYQAGTTRFLYAGSFLAAEYNTGGAVLRRYVPGPGMDEPAVWYEGSGTGDKHFLLADERGSIIAVTNGSGTVTGVNRYDEYGAPHAANVGRFQYTGQIWLPEAGLYHYKARAYNPRLGRFMQTDPIGYADGMNMYAYVRNDPVNGVDPMGLCTETSPFGGGLFSGVRSCGTRLPAVPWAFVDLMRPISAAWDGVRQWFGGGSGGEGGASGGTLDSLPEPGEVATQCPGAAIEGLISESFSHLSVSRQENLRNSLNEAFKSSRSFTENRSGAHISYGSVVTGNRIFGYSGRTATGQSGTSPGARAWSAPGALWGGAGVAGVAYVLDLGFTESQLYEVPSYLERMMPTIQSYSTNHNIPVVVTFRGVSQRQLNQCAFVVPGG